MVITITLHRLDLLIAETNRIYQASGVDIRFEAVDPLHYQPEDTSDFNNMMAYAESTEVQAWLQAAKKVKGGEGLGVVIMYPLAAQMGDSDFLFLPHLSL